jgi:hypothetical protein
MTVTELKEELQKLEDQGHGDKPVKYYDVRHGWLPAELEFNYDRTEVHVV